MANGVHVKQGGNAANSSSPVGSGDIEVWADTQHCFSMSDIPEEGIARVLSLSELVRRAYELGKKHTQDSKTGNSEYD